MPFQYLKQVTTQTIALIILANGIASFSVAQDSENELRKFRDESAKSLKEPEYSTPPRYLLVCIGKELKEGRWLAVGPKDVYFDSNGDGDLTDEKEHFTKFETIRQPPGARWKETRWFKVGVVGNVPLTLMIKIPSPLYRPQKMVMPSLKRELELDVKHQWGHGGLQYMAGKTGRQHMTLLRLTKEKENAQVTWINGPVSVAEMQEVIGQKAVFDISKRVLPGKLQVRLGTYGLPADESVVPSFTALDPMLIPKRSFPMAKVNFESGEIVRQMTRRVGGSGFMTQFNWPMKVTEDKVPVSVAFKDWAGNKVKPWEGVMRIIRTPEDLFEEEFVVPADAKEPTPVNPKGEANEANDAKKAEGEAAGKAESGGEPTPKAEPAPAKESEASGSGG